MSVEVQIPRVAGCPTPFGFSFSLQVVSYAVYLAGPVAENRSQLNGLLSPSTSLLVSWPEQIFWPRRHFNDASLPLVATGTVVCSFSELLWL